MESIIMTTLADPWAPYTPDEQAPWNLHRVVHLHRRAGFAATWEEIQRDLRAGPQASVARVLTGKARSQGVPATFAETAALLAETASRYDMGRFKAWWIYRMCFGPDPLTEKLTLLWHNHFATSTAKVRDGGVMHAQNELFRKYARARFADLLQAVLHDPAVLIYLDAPSNRKGHANENLARELMELFTLGIGHYSETDVKEGARALTGWTVEDNHFSHDESRHDPGSKTILGKKGNWTGDDLLRLLLEHPATSQRLAWRLCQQFLGEKVSARASALLAEGLREHQLDLGWGVKTILHSRAFFAAENMNTRIPGPVDFVVGAGRVLEAFTDPPSTLLLADWAARLGQDLFYPPNVGGWPGGTRWISTRTLIGRANFAAALVEGRLSRRQKPVDALGLAQRQGQAGDLPALITFFAHLILGRLPDEGWVKRVRASLGGKATVSAETARRIAALTLAGPEAQLM
jgi:uncharacterized protein (DUF1800 family)